MKAVSNIIAMEVKMITNYAKIVMKVPMFASGVNSK
jgi:hypothetical protein